MTDIRYAGMGYEAASREADRLIKAAAKTGSWWDLPEKLATLRDCMKRSLPAKAA